MPHFDELQPKVAGESFVCGIIGDDPDESSVTLSHVFLERGWQGERHGAVPALDGLLTCSSVGFHVPGQFTWLCARIRTESTFVRFLSCMRSPMNSQITTVFENLSAVLAHVIAFLERRLIHPNSSSPEVRIRTRYVRIFYWAWLWAAPEIRRGWGRKRGPRSVEWISDTRVGFQNLLPVTRDNFISRSHLVPLNRQLTSLSKIELQIFHQLIVRLLLTDELHFRILLTKKITAIVDSLKVVQKRFASPRHVLQVLMMILQVQNQSQVREAVLKADEAGVFHTKAISIFVW